MCETEAIDPFKTPIFRFGALALLTKQSVPPQVMVVNKVHLQEAGADRTWGLVGGHVNAGESVRDAVCRQVKRETGLELLPGRVLVSDQMPRLAGSEVVDGMNYVFDFRPLQGDEEITLSPELTEYRWVEVEQLGEFLSEEHVARVTEALRCAGTNGFTDLVRGKLK